ncbi:hypothetical protein F5883DRAFT_477163, partial [Diaporthe sp. PMI_573]
MYDKTTMCTVTCATCQVKTAPEDTERLQWEAEMSRPLKEFFSTKLACRQCFPADQSPGDAIVCTSCYQSIQAGKPPFNCGGDLRFITCTHLHPRELSDLTIAEERLISLNTPYGYITRYCRPATAGTSWHFRQHKKGHITVFINDVESLTATVLPHPLIKIMESIRVCWSGPAVPSAVDLSKLMSVRRHKVIEALRWKKQNDPLYSEVQIDEALISSWDIDPVTSVPDIVWSHLEHIDDSLVSDIRSAPVTSGVDRADQDDSLDNDVEGMLDEVVENIVSESTGMHGAGGRSSDGGNNLEGLVEEVTANIMSSGLYPLEGDGIHPEADRLDFICDALAGHSMASSGNDQSNGTGYEPFINVGRSGRFA